MKTPEFWYREDGPLAALLSPLGWIYGQGTALRRALARPWYAPVPVICVGNLVAGGAGKTPVALDLGARLVARGLTVHYLSRGFGGTNKEPLRVDPAHHGAGEVGDEPLLLARAAPCWVGADRPATARAAIAAGAEALIMDDGFQNPSLHKSLSLLAVDGRDGFGNGRLIPAGPLRENLTPGLARAEAAVVIGEDTTDAAEEILGRAPWPPTVLRAHLVAGPEAAELAGNKVFAFAGIGRPGKFFRTLSEIGCTLVETREFADHHPYGEADISAIAARAEALGAIPVTTEKDAVRLPAGRRPAGAPANIRVLSVSLTWEDEAAIQTLLDGVAAGSA